MNRAVAVALGGVGAGGVLYLAYDWLFVRDLRGKVAGGGTFKVHATGYWPETARADERKMEGKNVDRIGEPLHTVEDYQAGRSDHASVSGDPDIFPYGQKIVVDWFDGTIVGRVTDTGSHFHGLKKVYRVVGEEPLDFDVHSSSTPVPKHGVVARIVPGDHWASKTKRSVAEVATEKIKDQVVIGTVPRAAEIRRGRARQVSRGGLLSLGDTIALIGVHRRSRHGGGYADRMVTASGGAVRERITRPDSVVVSPHRSASIEYRDVASVILSGGARWIPAWNKTRTEYTAAPGTPAIAVVVFLLDGRRLASWGAPIDSVSVSGGTSG